jgi:hypothetical protein
MPAEKELSVQIRNIDRVKINHLDVRKSCEGEILEELTANASCSDEKDFTGCDLLHHLLAYSFLYPIEQLGIHFFLNGVI